METPAPIEPDLIYVGFWARVIASLVDSILLALLMLPIGWYVYGKVDLDFVGPGTDSSNFFISVLLPAIIVVVFWTQRQSTPGKMIFGARIVDARTGLEPGTGQWVIRYLAYYLSALVFFLGFLWVAFDRRKQGWHDKIAGTVVVRDRVRPVQSARFER